MTPTYLKNKTSKTLLFTILLAGFTACSDFIDIDPPKSELVSEAVFENDATASSAINGIYSLMMANTSFTRSGLEEYTGIASDELINYSTNVNRLQFYQNSLTALNADVLNLFWREAYKYISNANVILEGIEKPNGLTPDGKLKLQGEALFVRSFCFYYLANLFGDIPYLTTANYEINASAPRMPFNEVLSALTTDLLKARESMHIDFLDFQGARVRPTRDAATALLARVYLHQRNWQQAEAMATELINNPTYKLQSDLNKVFLANSPEAIWQLTPVIPSTDTPQASLFILSAAPNGSSRRVAMTPGLVNSFETNDQRKTKWTATFSNASGTWNYIYKYKKVNTGSMTEFSTVLRLAEQYLIRAEARANQNNLTGAEADVNTIRNRAGLPGSTIANLNAALSAIEQERRVELFGEFGHRWLDLKRTNRIDAVMILSKPTWQATDSLFPIPNSEILLNPNLAQNPGY